MTGGGPALLYSTHECLRINASSCLAKNHTLYQVISVLNSVIERFPKKSFPRDFYNTLLPFQDTTNGLDRAMQTHMSEVYSMLAMNGTYPTLTGPYASDFFTVWNLKPDIQGGA